MKPQLEARLGAFTTTAIVIGACIGSGIFKKSAIMAASLGSPFWLIVVWIVAGLITLCGALSNAEVASLFPKTGGQFIFFEKMYGSFFAYLYGWCIFSVLQTGSIAAVAMIFAESFGRTVRPGISEWEVKWLAIALVWSLTIVNYLGVKWGGLVQSIFTCIKIACLLALVGMIFIAPTSPHSLEFLHPTAPHSHFLFGLIAALSGAFWAYDGWNNVTFIAGEIKNPQRTLPRSLFIGVCSVIVLYVLVNIAYVTVLTFPELTGAKIAASEMAAKVFGDWGARAVLIAIALSTFGAVNGSILASARVYFAMAQEGSFFPSLGLVHPRFHTPHRSLVIQAVWTTLLALTGTFDTLSDMLMFVSWFFYGMSALGVFVLRKKSPHLERAYRVPGYPWVPALFVFVAFSFVVITFWKDWTVYQQGQAPFVNSILGLVIAVSGAPLYFYFKRAGADRSQPVP